MAFRFELLIDAGHLLFEIGERQRLAAPVRVCLAKPLPLGVLVQGGRTIDKLPLTQRCGALDTVGSVKRKIAVGRMAVLVLPATRFL